MHMMMILSIRGDVRESLSQALILILISPAPLHADDHQFLEHRAGVAGGPASGPPTRRPAALLKKAMAATWGLLVKAEAVVRAVARLQPMGLLQDEIVDRIVEAVNDVNTAFHDQILVGRMGWVRVATSSFWGSRQCSPSGCAVPRAGGDPS